MMCNKCSKDPCICGGKNGKCGSGCTMGMIAKTLLIIGGINWGLIGLGGFAGGDWNVVHAIFQSVPAVEWIIYILVGLVAVMKLFGGCKCKKCAGSCCASGTCKDGTCKTGSGSSASENMDGSM